MSDENYLFNTESAEDYNTADQTTSNDYAIMDCEEAPVENSAVEVAPYSGQDEAMGESNFFFTQSTYQCQ